MNKSPIVLLLIAWALLIFRIGTPFYGVQDAPRVWIAAAVRNYDLYGLENTGLMMIRNTTPTTPENFNYYSHHPPMMVWLPAFTTLPIGFNEIGIRFGFISVTLISVAALFVLARRLYDMRVARWATFFYLIVPMTAYLGRVPGQSQLSLMVSLLFGAVLVNWLRKPNPARFALLIALGVLAVWTAWAAVFMVAFLGVAAFWRGNGRQKRAIVMLACVMLVALIGLLLFYQVQWPDSIDSILEAFVWRTSSASLTEDSESFTAIAFVGRMFLHLISLITPGVTLLALWGILPLRKRDNLILLALFAGGLAYQLVFRNASYIHDYYKGFMLPAMAISAGAAFVYVRKTNHYTRPIMDAFLLTTIVISMVFTLGLHNTGHQPWIDAVIKKINSEPEARTIASNIIPNSANGYTTAIEFYTQRPIMWGLDAETARQRDVLYLYCTPQGVFPAVLMDYTYETVYENECMLFAFE